MGSFADRPPASARPHLPAGRRPAVLVAIAVGLLVAAGRDRPAPTREPTTVEQPSAVLERVIRTRKDLGRGGFKRWLTGQPDRPLFRRPLGVAWDGENLLVTDPGKGNVLRVDRRNRVATSPRGLFTSPVGIAACPQGILVSDSVLGGVALLERRRLGLVRWVAEDLERPTGVACEGDRLFIVETGRHRLLIRGAGAEDRARTLGERGKGPGEFNFPTVIAQAPDSLWVGDTLNFRLQRFDPVTGEYLGDFGRLGNAPGEMPRLKGLDIDSTGRLWVSDAHLDQIALYRNDGRFLASFGRKGSGPGEFSFPAGIAAHPDGRVAIVDSLNRRVQVFRLASEPPAESAR